MRPRALAWVMAAAAGVAAVGAGAAARANPLAHETIVLPNGMRVLVLSDHRTPRLVVLTRYRVGSADERAGRTGLAHLFEHLMFKGTPAIGDGVMDRLAEESGGGLNADTTQDATTYMDVAASSFLPRAPWYEGDRLAHLGESLDQAMLDNQRMVVLSERTEHVDNQPYGIAEPAIEEELWPVGHPYHEDTFGRPDDLKAASVADAKDFFETWYVPANATMVIVGDVDAKTVRELADKYLAIVPARPAPKHTVTPATRPIPQMKERHETDAVNATRVYVTWRAPRAFAADEPAMDMAAAILAGGKSSRLYRSLVHEKRLAQDVFAGQESMLRGGMFQIVATAKPGVEAAAVIDAIDDEMEALAKAAPDAAELERAQNEHETSLMTELQGLNARARLLAEYDAMGDADYFDKDLARYRAVTAADVQRVVRKYLGQDCRSILTITGNHAK